MEMKGKGIGAGGSGGDEAGGGKNGKGNGNGNGSGKRRERSRSGQENNDQRQIIESRIIASRTVAANGSCYCKGPNNPPAGDQHMADIGGSAPVNLGGASNSLTLASLLSGITVGGGANADPIPAWLTNLSKQLSDKSYPNFYAPETPQDGSSNSNAPATPEDDFPPSSPLRLRKMARYSSPLPATPPPSPARASDVLSPPWATGAGASIYSFKTTTPPLMSPVTGRIPGPDPVTQLAREEVMTEKKADEEEGKDRA